MNYRYIAITMSFFRWEEKSGNPFLVEGIRFSDYIHSQWEACERRKENEKQQRQEKKQQVS